MAVDDPSVRLARFTSGGEPGTGVVDQGRVFELSLSWAQALELLADGGPHVAALIGEARTGRSWNDGDVQLLAPFPPGADLFCVGLNYFEHQIEAAELVEAPPEAPVIFVKSHRAVAAPDTDLVLPAELSTEFDWEVELGVVIGRAARWITRDQAWEHVAGYCVVNDVTARDLQRRHIQWHLGKNVARSTPVGPYVVARTAETTPPDLTVELSVNGVPKQSGRTSELIFDIPMLIELLSRTCGLEAGDVIATGTPSGVGFKRTPPEFLRDGDRVEATVQGVGTLANGISTAGPSVGTRRSAMASTSAAFTE